MCLGFLEWLCGSSCMMFLGILNWVWNLFYLEKSTCCFVGAPKVFGTEGMLGSSDVWAGWLCPWISVQSLRLNHVQVVELIFYGDFVVGYELSAIENNLLTPRNEIKMSAWSFVVHRIKAIELRCLFGSWRRKIFESELSCFSKSIKIIF
jgi:hypothetical protein